MGANMSEVQEALMRHYITDGRLSDAKRIVMENKQDFVGVESHTIKSIPPEIIWRNLEDYLSGDTSKAEEYYSDQRRFIEEKVYRKVIDGGTALRFSLVRVLDETEKPLTDYWLIVDHSRNKGKL